MSTTKRAGEKLSKSLKNGAAPAPAPAPTRAPRSSKPGDPDWEGRLGFLMHDVSRLRRSVLDEFMKPIGLTRSQWWILGHLAKYDGMIQSDLANVLDLGKASLGGLLDRLEASKFIERRPDETDRRVKRVYLTNKGAQILVKIQSNAYEMSDRILKGLDDKAREALAESLALVKANLLEIKAEFNITEEA